MKSKPLALASLALAIAALPVVPTAEGRPQYQGQFPRDWGKMVRPAPRNADGGGSSISELVWVDEVVRYDDFENFSVRRDQLPTFTIGSETWIFHVTENRIDISWKKDSCTNVLITGEDLVQDGRNGHPSSTGNSY